MLVEKGRLVYEIFNKNSICYFSLLFLIIGAIGAVLPILPTTPFLLAASFFFTKGSRRFNKWFVSTKLYKNYLKNFLESKAITFKTKIKILIPVTIMLIIAIYLVSNMHAKIIIVCVMLYKYYYFRFNIKTQMGKKKRRKHYKEKQGFNNILLFLYKKYRQFRIRCKVWNTREIELWH